MSMFRIVKRMDVLFLLSAIIFAVTSTPNHREHRHRTNSDEKADEGRSSFERRQQRRQERREYRDRTKFSNAVDGTRNESVIIDSDDINGTNRTTTFRPPISTASNGDIIANVNRGVSTILRGVSTFRLSEILRGSFMFTRNERVRDVANTVIDSIFGKRNESGIHDSDTGVFPLTAL